jgi:hypothetical protein
MALATAVFFTRPRGSRSLGRVLFHHQLAPQLIFLAAREADVPNALVVATPVSVKRKEAASLEVLVVEPPRNGADLAERPPAPSSCMYIDVHEWSRHSHLLQSVHDVPLALPLLQQKSAQATAEMTVDTVHSRVMLPVADREVAK